MLLQVFGFIKFTNLVKMAGAFSATSFVILVLQLLISPPSGDTQDSINTLSSCIADFAEFQKKAFANNTCNNIMQVNDAFNPLYGHAPYSLMVTYKTVKPNGSQKTLLTTEFCQRLQLAWLSSVVFVYSRPEILNRLSLYTLNYFEEWKPRKITLVVPYPCPNKTEELLLKLTASVS